MAVIQAREQGGLDQGKDRAFCAWASASFEIRSTGSLWDERAENTGDMRPALNFQRPLSSSPALQEEEPWLGYPSADGRAWPFLAVAPDSWSHGDPGGRLLRDGRGSLTAETGTDQC